MHFWTLLVITFGAHGAFKDQVSYLPYPDMQTCGDAMTAVAGTLQPTFPDVMLQCIETDELNEKVRPLPRPEGLK